MENKKLYHDKHQAIAIGATFYIHTKQVPTYITTSQNKQRRKL